MYNETNKVLFLFFQNSQLLTTSMKSFLSNISSQVPELKLGTLNQPDYPEYSVIINLNSCETERSNNAVHLLIEYCHLAWINYQQSS